MNKITFPRKDVDGKWWNQKDIEDWFINEFYEDIKNRLSNNVQCKNDNEKGLLNFITDNLKNILLDTPPRMKTWLFHMKLYRVGKLSTIFIKQLNGAFNYSNYRENKLIDFAKILNVKCCPYCNMHYTLFAEEKNKGKTVKKLAKFQFDHFYNKSEYPILSMSLYNLIPSCPICNQSKSKKELSLSYHPYHSDISKQFKFELNNPINLYIGAKANDLIDVKFIATDSNKQSDLDDFINTFHLKALYQRHGDIAREVFDKAYVFPYYSNPQNFKNLTNISQNYLKRLWYGTYMNENEIEKRPMTKFIQDLKEQAGMFNLSAKRLNSTRQKSSLLK